MYRINNGYCKLKKKIGELESQIKENHSDDINLSNTVQQIEDELTSAVIYKGSVSTFNDLPEENLKVGDMYDVQNSDNNYIWNGTGWDSTTKLISFDFVTEEQIEQLFE